MQVLVPETPCSKIKAKMQAILVQPQPEQKRQKQDDVSFFNNESMSRKIVFTDDDLQSASFKELVFHSLHDEGRRGNPGVGVLCDCEDDELCYACKNIVWGGPGDTERKCDEQHVCGKYEHGEHFGSPMYDLLSVVLMRNELYEPEPDDVNEIELRGELYGTIQPYDDPTPGYSCYYVKEENAMKIDLTSKKVCLTLSGPSRIPPPSNFDSLFLGFPLVFNGRDLFEDGFSYENYDLFGDREVSTASICMTLHTVTSRDADVIVRNRICSRFDPIALVANIALYQTGVWASVVVKLFSKESVNKFSGYIMAHPCVFDYKLPLLSINPGEEVEVKSGGEIMLRRSILAIPSYASLIIKAELHDQLGNVIVSGITFLPVDSKGTDTKFIGSEEVGIRVSVTWTCYAPRKRPTHLPSSP